MQVAVLPSIVKSFAYQSIDTDTYPSGFMPEETYAKAIETFQRTLIRFLQELVMAQMFGDAASIASDEQKRRNVRVKEFIELHLEVRSMDHRPLVVYPQNAENVIQNVLP